MPHSLRWLALLAPLAACSTTSPSSQVITGRIAAGFPTQVTEVRALAGGQVVARAAIAADGSFSIAVPPQADVALDAVGAAPTRIVFPRSGGTIDTRFAIRAGGGAYDLGAVRFVGDAASVTFAVHDGAGSGSDACDGDGKDSAGATCVDDGDHGDGSTCDGGGDNGNDGSATSGGHDGSDDAASDGDGSDDGDAVCDHNFPSDGCSDDGDGHDGSGDDGSGDGSGEHDGSGSDTGGSGAA